MITETQREQRQSHIGSSDMASILGLDPDWGNPSDILLEKAGQLVPDKTSEPAQFGSDIEDSLLRWFAREAKLPQRGLMLLRNQKLVAEPFACHLDAGIVTAGKRSRADINEIVEAKWTSLVEEWGDEMTNEIPDRHLVQTHVQMYCVGEHCRVAWVPVMMPGYRLPTRRIYRVERDEDLIKAIVGESQNFWRSVRRYRETGQIDLPSFSPRLEVLKRWKREPVTIQFGADHLYQAAEGADSSRCGYCGTAQPSADEADFLSDDLSTECPKAPASLVKRWETAKARRLGADSDVEGLLAEILTHLRQAQAAGLPDGREFRFAEENAAPKCDRSGLQLAHPEIYQQYFTPNTRRVPRVTTPKVKTKGASL